MPHELLLNGNRICEFCFGRDLIRRELGYSMHVFLLNIPRLEFAALIPKGDYVTLCLLGHDLDKELVSQFINSREVRQCLPPNWEPPADFCHCAPKIAVTGAVHPFADRLVFVGDCGTTRLYKDGIGSAYRTAKAAARTIVFHGFSENSFRRHYWPVCTKISRDNAVGQFVFGFTRRIQKYRFARRGLWRMVSKEQRVPGLLPGMSTVLWDTFTPPNWIVDPKGKWVSVAAFWPENDWEGNVVRRLEAVHKSSEDASSAVAAQD